MLTLTPEERAALARGVCQTSGPKALKLIDALTAQAQRDFELAAEWQATAERYRVEAQAQRARADAAEQRLAERART